MWTQSFYQGLQRLTMKQLYLTLFLLAALLNVTSCSYKTVYLEPNCKVRGSAISFPLGSSGESTALMIKPRKKKGYDKGNDCDVTILANTAKEHVMLNVKMIDFEKSYVCRNYIEIITDSFHTERLCGKRKDMSFSNAKTNIMGFRFHTESSEYFYGGFEIIATSYTGEPCTGDFDFRCNNHNCISSSLTCDGYNNCGDGSDEAYDNPANCRLGKGVIVGIVIGALLLIALVAGVIWFFQRRGKVTRTVVHQTPAPMANPTVQHNYQYPQDGLQNPNYGIQYPQPPPYQPYQK